MSKTIEIEDRVIERMNEQLDELLGSKSKMEEIQKIDQLEQSWLNKCDYEYALMCDINSDNPHITWDEFYEINDMHVEFEECLDKLDIKPYINSFSYN